MWQRLSSIFWLGTKELRSLKRDKVLLAFLVYSFSLAIYVQARARSAMPRCIDWNRRRRSFTTLATNSQCLF